MIPINRQDVYEQALIELEQFAIETQARGRFIAIYLGLRRMGNAIAPLGSDYATPSSEIESFLDNLYAKTHLQEPFVVLTALFGQSTSATAPYSSRSGLISPGHGYPTNTWRNNFGIQKGIGCPADSDVILNILNHPLERLSCPYIMNNQSSGEYSCSFTPDHTRYRGESHSIWLRQFQSGYQVVDLNHQGAYKNYLRPLGKNIPVFPLIAALYGFSQDGIFPYRASVGIPEFAQDFGFSEDQVDNFFDCNPDSDRNARLLATVNQIDWAPVSVIDSNDSSKPTQTINAGLLPEIGLTRSLNTGTDAEVKVARQLELQGWNVSYYGNSPGCGYDLLAKRGDEPFYIEVKSSVSRCVPELTNNEWETAQKYSDKYIIAVVDYLGSPGETIKFIRNPAGMCKPDEIPKFIYRLPRSTFSSIAVAIEFL